MASEKILRVVGRGCVLRGNDIDTDRIIPARFLRCVSFDGLGEHAFEDDRAQAKGDHPLDDERFRGAKILIVGHNFGSGSSREHAPQALMRWGIQGVVAESFAEIFHGNCTAMGVPCVTAEAADIRALMDAVETDPSGEIAIDLRDKTLSYGDKKVPIQIPEGVRVQLLEGAWDATGMLLEGADAVRQVAKQLPYISGF
jgi:3-isopropylmalate/(R)-2-methylmalate dehydratase small subunit